MPSPTPQHIAILVKSDLPLVGELRTYAERKWKNPQTGLETTLFERGLPALILRRNDQSSPTGKLAAPVAIFMGLHARAINWASQRGDAKVRAKQLRKAQFAGLVQISDELLEEFGSQTPKSLSQARVLNGPVNLSGTVDPPWSDHRPAAVTISTQNIFPEAYAKSSPPEARVAPLIGAANPVQAAAMLFAVPVQVDTKNWRSLINKFNVLTDARLKNQLCVFAKDEGGSVSRISLPIQAENYRDAKLRVVKLPSSDIASGARIIKNVYFGYQSSEGFVPIGMASYFIVDEKNMILEAGFGSGELLNEFKSHIFGRTLNAKENSIIEEINGKIFADLRSNPSLSLIIPTRSRFLISQIPKNARSRSGVVAPLAGGMGPNIWAGKRIAL